MNENVEAEVSPQTFPPPPPVKPRRRPLPDERNALTHKFSVAGHEGYLSVGLYADGSLGEVFLTMEKETPTTRGLLDAFAAAISISLQYGIPLDVLVHKFSHMRFEPAGYTKNSEIPVAKSVIDYVFRYIGRRFLGIKQEGEVERPLPEPPKTEDNSGAPSCHECGSLMVRGGPCYKCLNCGATSGVR